MHCSECGATFATGAKFCSNCGNPIADPDEDFDESWDFDSLDPQLGPFRLDQSAASFGWTWWSSSFFFGRSGWRPVLFEQFAFEDTYRLNIAPLLAILGQIRDQQDSFIATVQESLSTSGRDLSAWAVALAGIDKVLINHDGKRDVAAVYFGEHIDFRGYRFACVNLGLDGTVIGHDIGSI